MAVLLPDHIHQQRLTLLLLILLCSYSSLRLISCECPSNEWTNNSVTKKCYMATAKEYSYTSCYEQCVPGYPVCIVNEEENSEVYQFFEDSDIPHRGFYVGIDDRNKEGTWEWSKGCFSDYLHFREGEPNNCAEKEDCAVALGEEYTSDSSYLDGIWVDTKCSLDFVCMCEYTGSTQNRNGKQHQLKVSNETCLADEVIDGLIIILIVTLGCCCLCVCCGTAARAHMKKGRQRESRVVPAVPLSRQSVRYSPEPSSIGRTVSLSAAAGRIGRSFSLFSISRIFRPQAATRYIQSAEESPGLVSTIATISSATDLNNVLPPIVTPRIPTEVNTSISDVEADATPLPVVDHHDITFHGKGPVRAVPIDI